MKKQFLVFFLLFVCGSALFAGPFGLEKGMSFNEIKKACGGKEPVKVDEGIYYVEPPKQHPLFDKYVAFIDEKEGLHFLKGIGKDITTSGYGFDLKNNFEDLEKSVSKTYGKDYKLDVLLPGSIWDEPKDFMMSLLKEERALMAEWSKDYGSTIPDDIESICIAAYAVNSSTGYLVIEYSFTNHNSIKARKTAEEDSVF